MPIDYHESIYEPPIR